MQAGRRFLNLSATDLSFRSALRAPWEELAVMPCDGQGAPADLVVDSDMLQPGGEGMPEVMNVQIVNPDPPVG